MMSYDLSEQQMDGSDVFHHRTLTENEMKMIGRNSNTLDSVSLVALGDGWLMIN